MIVTRGLGRSSVCAALVAAGLCVSIILSPPPNPILANVLFIAPEVRIVKESDMAEQRVLVVQDDERVLSITEEVRKIAVTGEQRILIVIV